MNDKYKVTIKKPDDEKKKFIIRLKKSFKGNPNGKKLA